MQPDPTGDPKAGLPPHMRPPDEPPLEVSPPEVSPGLPPEMSPPGSAPDVSPLATFPPGFSAPLVTPGDHPMSYRPAAPVEPPPVSRSGRWELGRGGWPGDKALADRAAGSREVACLLYDPAGRLVGTMKGRAL